MGGVHFTRVHNHRVSASAVLLALFAHYQGPSFVPAPRSTVEAMRLMATADNCNSLSIC